MAEVCNTEIHQHRAPVLSVQHDVVGFYVPVHTALATRIIQRPGDVLDHADALVEAQFKAPVLQVPAGNVLHGQKVVAPMHTDIVDRDDIRVNQTADNTGFVQEPLAEGRVA